MKKTAKTEAKEKTMNYNEAFNYGIILNAMPLAGITGKELCDIIMVQLDYSRIIDAFNARMDDGLKKLKANKFPRFDEESGKPEEERCAEYKEWLAELETLYGEMRQTAAMKPVEEAVPVITRDIFVALCSTGAEGDIILPGGTEASPNLMPKATALRMLASIVTDKDNQ